MEKRALQTAGVVDALRNFGMAAGRSVANVAKNPGQLLPSMSRIKREAIGNPGKFYRQFQNDRLFDRSGMYRMMLKPQGTLHAALTYGLPALSIYQASQAPDDTRGAAIGNTIGSVAGGFLGGPLGAVGQAVGSMALGSLGQNVGKSFDPSYT
jgi:hypothetical protein